MILFTKIKLGRREWECEEENKAHFTLFILRNQRVLSKERKS